MSIYGFRATDDEESYTCIVRSLIVCNLIGDVVKSIINLEK